MLHSHKCAQSSMLHSQRQSNCTRSALRHTESPLVSLKRLPDAQTAAATVVERRAGDVAVVGGGLTAVLAAYSLAKSGRKVLLLPDFGLAAPRPASSPLQPLKLTDPDPLLVHLAAESAQYWRGLELLASTTLLLQQQTLDVVQDPERDHAGAAGFSKLQGACAAAGVPASLLSSAEATAAFRAMQLPHGSAAILQGQGGIIQAAEAAAAAQQLAQNMGVQIKEGLLLRGWRDRGSCFELRASSALSPELVSLFEAEVLLLAPAHWHHSALALFGLQLEGLQDVEILSSQVGAGDEALKLPAVFSWGAFTAADSPLQSEGASILPRQHAGGSPGLLLQQLPAWGSPVADPLSWQPASRGWSSRLAEMEAAGDAPGQQGTTTLTASTSSCAWVNLQVQQLHASCSSLVRGIAPLQAVTAVQSSVQSVVEDGRPLLGSHPGYDAGRVVCCCGASGSRQFGPGSSCSSSFQLSPMLAKLASDLIRSAGASAAGGSGGGAVLQGLGLSSERTTLKVVSKELNGWEQLSMLQQPHRATSLEQEQELDEAADMRQDVQNLEPFPGR